MTKSQYIKAKETLKNMMLKKISEFEKDITDYTTFRTAVLNGTKGFLELSETGEYFFLDEDLAKLFCTPKQFERLLARKQFPQDFYGRSWLKIQASALRQCNLEIAKERGYISGSFIY